jgi:mannose-6-phosphate isomerase-like protein (cupin superfamily)
MAAASSGDGIGLLSRRMNTSTGLAHVSLAEALLKGSPPPGNLAVPVFSHGSLAVELYTPVGHDPQQPHTRDEIYFVARGNGFFVDGERRHPVEAGSFLFVPAGRSHHFENFSTDFAVWVAFYGPEGGETEGGHR